MTTAASTLHYTGRCFCAAITYTITAATPQRAYLCHCTDCRHSIGSSYAHSAMFDTDSVIINDPDKQMSTYGNIEEGSKRFCGRCGSPLFLTPPLKMESMRGKVLVCVGTVDGGETREELRPVAEGFCKRREGWLKEVEGAEEFDEW